MRICLYKYAIYANETIYPPNGNNNLKILLFPLYFFTLFIIAMEMENCTMYVYYSCNIYNEKCIVYRRCENVYSFSLYLILFV